MAKLFLLLGGNLGDKKQVFDKTLQKVTSRLGQISCKSGVYETEPWGFESDNLFWNQVVLVETSLKPVEILEEVKQIEKELGRVRHSKRYASRVIDLDLLFYDALILRTPSLELPHPRIAERRFVLAPLNEIAPGFIHPVLKKTVANLLSECPDQLKVRKLDG